MESVKVIMRSQRSSRRFCGLLSFLIVVIGLFSTACGSREPSSNSSRRTIEASPPSTQSATTGSAAASPTGTPIEKVELPPPKPEEVREAVARVYKDAVTIDARHEPAYVIGDFNGDDSQDIAVIVRPMKDKLEDINSEVANWILEDPRQVMLPDPHRSVQPLSQIKAPEAVKQSDLLLTIIHGYQKEGWRNAAAQQTYLLNNAVGNSMTATPVKDLQSTRGNQNQTGDVINETLAGEKGFLYWTGAKYAWRKQ